MTPWQLATAKNNSLFIDALAAFLSPMDAERALLKPVVEHVSGCFDQCSATHTCMYLLCMCVLQAYLRACATGCIANVVALEARLAALLGSELLVPSAVDRAIRGVRTIGIQAACERGHVAVVKYMLSGARARTVPIPDLTVIVSREVGCQPSTLAQSLI